MVSGKWEDADTSRGLIRSQLGPNNTLRQEEPVPCGPGRQAELSVQTESAGTRH